MAKPWTLRPLMVIWITHEGYRASYLHQVWWGENLGGNTSCELEIFSWPCGQRKKRCWKKRLWISLWFQPRWPLCFSPQYSDFCLFSVLSTAHFPVDMIKTFYQKQHRGRLGLFGLKLISSLTSREAKAKVEEQCVLPCLSRAHV